MFNRWRIRTRSSSCTRLLYSHGSFQVCKQNFPTTSGFKSHSQAYQQTCAQYLRTHESAVLEAVGLTQSSNGSGNGGGGGNGDAVVEPFGASGSTSPVVSGQQQHQQQQQIYSGRPVAAAAAGVVLTSSSHAVLATSQHLAGAYGEAAAAAAGSHANKRRASDVL
ncbi:unnamed protein product [Trichogramma brassicae]|uniref:Uncharacterized protein n=1 Tax=Trichogramma brassicae TaxID=86971 RepID=A0A6H5J0M3_9HYME|nr:unnamed protein product [Trichogramma brassicae]